MLVQKSAKTPPKWIYPHTKTRLNLPLISNWAQLKLASLARFAAKRSESVFSILARFLCFRNAKRRILGSYDAASAFLLVSPFLCCCVLLISLICAVFSILRCPSVLLLVSPCSCLFCADSLLYFAADFALYAALVLSALLSLLCAA